MLTMKLHLREVVAFLIVQSLVFEPAAVALQIEVDGFLISDGQQEDLQLTSGNLRFDSEDPNFGFATNTGYAIRGTVVIASGANSEVALDTGQTLILTEFQADAITSASVPQMVTIRFEHQFTGVVNVGGLALDYIEAYSSDGTGAGTYGFSSNDAQPLLAGEDILNRWQGFIDNVPIDPFAPSPFPAPNGAGLNQIYTGLPFTRTEATIDMFNTSTFSPLVRGQLDFTLGGARNQFIMNDSAVVGFTPPVPEPSTVMLAILAFVGLLTHGRRRRA